MAQSGKLKAIDIFSGCGGLTQGLKNAGFDVIGAVDIDPLSVKTYKKNHPEVEVWQEDISNLSIHKIKRKLRLKKGELDLLAGCPPCQGFSSIRTLNGALDIDDPRNDLLSEFLAYTIALMPRSVMMENVPGLSDDSRFDVFCIEMEKLGYNGHFKILNAADYNVPQRRRRLIYLAGCGFKIPFATKRAKQKTVFESIGKLPLPGISGDNVHDFKERRSKKIMDLIKAIPKDGGSRTDLPEEKQLECHKRCNGFKDVYGRMSWNKVSPTITSGCFNPSKGRFIHPDQDRAITIREAALLQGFPRKYKFPVVDSKSALALMVGNALPPPFIAAHARSIKKVLNSEITAR